MFKDSLIYLASKFVPAILSISVLFIFLTSMPPEDYGVYSVLILSVGLLNILSSQWIRSSMLRFYNDNISNFMGKTFSFQLIVLLINVCVVVTLSIIMKLSIILIFILIIYMMNFVINEIMNNYFRTIIEPKKVLNGNLIKNFLFIIFLCIGLVLFKEISINLAVFSFTLGLFISNTFYFYYYDEKMRFEYDKTLLKQFFMYGVPLTISFALGVLLQNIDKYLITIILGVKSNGYYSLVYDFLHNSLYMVMGALAMASLPRLLKMESKNIVNSFNLYVQYVYLISLPLVGIILVLTPELVYTLNYFNYKTTNIIITFVILATFVHGINTYIYSQSVQLLKKTSVIFLPSLIAVIVSVLLNFLLLDKIGVVAAAISSLISFSTSNLLILRVLKKQSDITYVPKNVYFILPIVIFVTLIFWNFSISNVALTIIIKLIISIFIYSIYIYTFRNKLIKKV